MKSKLEISTINAGLQFPLEMPANEIMKMLKAPYFFLENNALKIYVRIQRIIFKTKKLLGCK